MKKKGLKFTKKKLIELYWKKGLSLSKIGEEFCCTGTNILYWLKKFNIKRRPAYPKKIDIPKETLRKLYWKKGLSSTQIAKIYGIKHGRTILKKLVKYNIPTKTVSQALTRKPKLPFSNNLIEKAYLIGLRAGDFYAKRNYLSIRFQTTTTHSAQMELAKRCFKKYGKVCKCIIKSRNIKELFVYVDLHPSFDFLLPKPKSIPSWILNDNHLFYAFLSAYADCEGNWNITKSHKRYRFMFRIRSGDRKILVQIKNKLRKNGFNPVFYLEVKSGNVSPYGVHKKNIYNLTLYRKKEIISLIKKLLPLSKHNEKTRKMKFILKNNKG
jgi:hypothetical protein